MADDNNGIDEVGYGRSGGGFVSLGGFVSNFALQTIKTSCINW